MGLADTFVADPPVPGGLAASFVPDVAPVSLSPLETFGAQAVNVFGAGPAIAGAIGAVQGHDYAASRDAYAQMLAQAEQDNPLSSKAGRITSLLPETVIGGAAGKLVAPAVKAFSTAARLGKTASAAAGGVVGGAGFGAAGEVGKGLSAGKDAGDIALDALEGGLTGGALGGVLGGAAHKVGEFLGKAGEREVAGLVPEIAEGAGAKAAKRLAKNRENIVEVLKTEPTLLAASRRGALEALPVFKSKLEEIGGKLDPLYKQIDAATGGVSVRELVGHLDSEIKSLNKTPLNEAYSGGLQKIRDSILDAWAPAMRDAEKVAADLRAQGITRIPASLTPQDVLVPTQAVRKLTTQLQTRAVGVADGLHPSEAAKAKAEFAVIVKGFLDSHLDAGGAKALGLAEAVKAIREINKKYSAVAQMLEAVEQRSVKEATAGGTKTIARDILHRGSMIGAGVAAITGHPLAALGSLASHQIIDHLPALAKAADSRVAHIQRLAEAGNPQALKLIRSVQAARQVGTAGAGAAGSSLTTTMGAEQ